MTDYANYWHSKGKNGKKKEIKPDFHSLISGSVLEELTGYDKYMTFMTVSPVLMVLG